MQITEIPTVGWYKIVHITDERSKLDALVSVHNKNIGPGLGGCRIYDYENFDAGLEDVKRLSRGMTYKNALGGIPFGGGKAVIFADPKNEKTDDMFHVFGEALEALKGDYITAEDSGATERDMELISERTKFVSGISINGKGGNPSPFTGYGVWRGMQAAATFKLGVDSLNGLRVNILGLGAVGMNLAERLHGEGAQLFVADINNEKTEYASKNLGATILNLNDIITNPADIFAPCALGGSINTETIQKLRVQIIAGAANNQLASPEMDQALHDRGILYAPDYVINAAGVISCGHEYMGDWEADALYEHLDQIPGTLHKIFTRAKDNYRPTGIVANEIAEEIFGA